MDFPRNCEMETVATCSMTDGNGSYHRDSRHRFSKRWHVASVKNIAGDDQTTLMVHGTSANIACSTCTSVYVCAIATVVPRLTVVAVATHPNRRISKRWHVADVKKLHWRWPGNPNGQSKFRNLGLFTFTWSQLTLRWRLRGWWRLPKIAQTARCRRQKHRRRWPGSIEMPQIRKFMPTRSSKASLKTSFAATNDAAIDGIAHRLLSCYHSQRLLFSHSKNNFSMTLTPPKNRDIHIVEFFCRFYL